MGTKLQPLPTSRNLGWMLQSVRKSKGLTQAHLASRVGVGQSRISHLEQHPDELSVQQLLAWCSALNLELSIGPKDNNSDSGAPKAGGSKPAW
jgi:HTH-type transcriptional regulator / antitoxin HipB